MKKLGFLLVIAALVTACAKKPTSSFTPSATEVAVGDPVVFTDASTDAEKASYHWDFGDGNTSDAVNPSHIYERPGTYTVSLTVSTKKGKHPNATTATITVSGGTAAFTGPASAKTGEMITFTNTSENADNYHWDFGDGNTSTSVNPSHMYNQSGTYTVELAVYNVTAGGEYKLTGFASQEVTVTGGSGDHTTEAKIIGTWNYDTYKNEESYDGNSVLSCDEYTITYDVQYEFTDDGSVIVHDNGEENYSNWSWYVLDDSRIMWGGNIYQISVSGSSMTFTRVEYSDNGGMYDDDCSGSTVDVSWNEMTETQTYSFSK